MASAQGCDGTTSRSQNMIVAVMYRMKSDRMKSDRMKSDRMKSDRMKSDRMKSDRMKSDRTRGTGRGPLYLDTDAKPGHTMLPDTGMGFYQVVD